MLNHGQMSKGKKKGKNVHTFFPSLFFFLPVIFLFSFHSIPFNPLLHSSTLTFPAYCHLSTNND